MKTSCFENPKLFIMEIQKKLKVFNESFVLKITNHISQGLIKRYFEQVLFSKS